MSDRAVPERALLLVPHGRDSAVATQMLAEASIEATACASIDGLVAELARGVGFVLITEEALATADASALALWLALQEEWSDLPFILLTTRGGGLERNPTASRYINLLGNVTFLERPFHPTTLVSLAQAALRGRRRQYEARARLEELRQFATTLEDRVRTATAERETALARLHQAQKLEMLGQLTGGVAHDFNNLLTPIMGALDLLNRRSGEDERSTRLIGGALESAERAKTLVQRLLGFARRQTLQTAPVDLAALLEGMRDLIASSIGPIVELRMRWQDGLPAALIDPHQLELALLNLCVNARDAMPDGGALTITVETGTLAEGELPETAPGPYLLLSVIDTGVGMDEVGLVRAIEPFYSTKEVGKGTGLGLSMVHGLASQLGGGFRLASAPGEGTSAMLWLPIAVERGASPRHHAPEEPAGASRNLSILLVDDEHLVRSATAEMLRELGHSVVEAHSGEAALSRLAEQKVDMVMTDYKMPHMDGAVLADRVRSLRADMPVLLITGYASASGPALSLPRLEKPFRRGALARALESVMMARENAAGANMQG